MALVASSAFGAAPVFTDVMPAPPTARRSPGGVVLVRTLNDSFFGFGGFNGGATSGTSPDQMERIKQMVTQGQMPSLDQLQGMFNAGGVKMGI